MTTNWLRYGMRVVVATALVAGCGTTAGDGDESGMEDDGAPPLARLDQLSDGAPAPGSLPDESKPDAVYPTKYDLVRVQSPVKSQGSRGVCSIFAATALVEHLYKAEGTFPDIDFSEQYLQWAVKTVVRGFPDSEGSSANYNLRAASEHGMVEERVWPYETQPWGTSNDPACDGEDGAPVKCWTNGEPPAAASSATKFKIPSGRWMSSSTNTIKAHMVSKKTAVVVGGTFFYQSWNHGRSELPVNSTYFSAGYVLSPNAEDRAKSEAKRAGHEILLVGWDDTLEVQTMDKEGKPVVDARGRPVMEKGFFLFKNSWGTGKFGTTNPFGAGYGWISYKYVKDHFSAYASAIPTISTTRAEVCGNGVDDDRNGKTDCADTACSREAACNTGGGVSGGSSKSWNKSISRAIPDNSVTGITSSISVTDTGTVKSVRVAVDVEHPYRGDVTITLEKDGVVAAVVEADGDDGDNIVAEFPLTAFNGKQWKGSWKLRVADTARGDTGKWKSWKLTLTK